MSKSSKDDALQEAIRMARQAGWSASETQQLEKTSGDHGFVRFSEISAQGAVLEYIDIDDEACCALVAEGADFSEQATAELKEQHGVLWFSALLKSPARDRLIKVAEGLSSAVQKQRRGFFVLPSGERFLLPEVDHGQWEPWLDPSQGRWTIRLRQ